MDPTVGLEPPSSSSSETLAESLLFEILALPVAERAPSLEAMCGRHPELATTLRRRLSLLAEELPSTNAEEPAASFGRFELLRRLGSGTADVYLAHDPAAGAEVVVKFLRHPELLDADTRLSLEREATAAASLDHPCIGSVLEIGEFEGMPYVVQPFVDGITLAEWLERHRERGAVRERTELAPADVELVLGWLEEIARALHVAHEHGLVHRDVKPDNILLPFLGRPRLIDFGLCQEVRPAPAGAPALPVGGTLAYMAPELLSPRERPVGPGADIHALGVTLFECVTLRLPFLGADEQQLCRAILMQEPPDARRLCRRLPRGLHRVIACALAKAAWERYPTAVAFADDLARLLAGKPVAPPRIRLSRRISNWCRAHRSMLLAAVLLFVPLLLLLYAERIHAGAKHADLELLSVPARLSAAETLARELVPGWPDQAQALTAWMAEEGEPLAALLPAVRTRLAGLDRDASADPAFAATLRKAHELLEPFATGERGMLARVRERLAWARQVSAVTLEAPAAAWQETIAAVAADPRYRGLRLLPQLDLVPLGRDPVSGLFEFHHPRSGWPGTPTLRRDDPTGNLRLHDLSGLVFVLIPPGRCLLGEQGYDPRRPRYDPEAAGYSEPFEFEFEPFFVSKYEMTQGQWLRLTGEQPALFCIGRRYFDADSQIGYRHPVESVSALQCDEVLREFGLLLPTEAQWEYSCGAGASTRWFFGNDPDLLSAYANIDDRRYFATEPDLVGATDADDGFKFVAPVGRYRANPFGLHDIYGNVSEWCRDTCVDHKDSVPLLGDGLRLPPAPHGQRSVRGSNYAQSLFKTSSRRGATPDLRNHTIGLRPARLLQKERR